MNDKNKIIQLLTAAVLLLSSLFLSSGSVFAQEYDPQQQGSISIALDDIDTDLANVVFNCYKVADPADGMQLIWVPADGFEGLASDFFDLETAEDMQKAARVLEEMTASANLSGSQVKTDSAGKAVFEALDQGVYLITQKDTANYGIVEPFLVFLPYTLEGTQWVYDVSAQVKGEAIEPESTPTPTPEEEEEDVPPKKPSENQPAETGDSSNVIFMIWLAVAAGGICFMAGIKLLTRKRDAQE